MLKQKISRLFTNPRTLFVGTLAVALALNSQGYCSDEVIEPLKDRTLDDMTGDVQNLLFGSKIRKIALTLGLGAGLFQSFMSGSIRPLLIYGGIGVAVCFLPKIAGLISNI